MKIEMSVDNELTMSVGCVLILAPLNQIGWPLLWNDAEVDPFNWRKNGWGSIEIPLEQIQTFWQEGGGNNASNQNTPSWSAYDTDGVPQFTVMTDTD